MEPEQVIPAGSRIVQFLRHNRVWFVADDRPKARQACVEVLTRIPPRARTFIINSKRLLLIAPGARMPAMAHPFQVGIEGLSGRATHCTVIYLDPRLEQYDYVQSLIHLALCVANSIQAVAEKGDSVRAAEPRDLLELWGFGREMAKARNVMGKTATNHVAGANHVSGALEVLPELVN